MANLSLTAESPEFDVLKEETMSGWTSCLHCGLKHSTRPDGLCPRCRQPGEAGAEAGAPPPLPSFAQDAPPSGGTVYQPPGGNVYAPPQAVFQAAPPVARPAPRILAPDEVPLGARLAGIVFVLNGICLLIESGMGVKNASNAITSGPPISAFVDLLVGAFLLAGAAKVLGWARARVILGAVILPLALFVQGNAMMAGIQIAFSLSLLALLVGDASKLRIGVAMTVLGLYITLELVGLVSA
jgi:hypothetical protein